jgi:HTH-type transcriptional regulator/antitoxin HigA
MEIMPVRSRRKTLDPDTYTQLFREALPIPPKTESANERLIALLANIDERETLTAEEAAFAELLAIVIEDFENKHYNLPSVPPHMSLQALMEDRGLQHKDVAAVVGNKGLTTEIIAGRRKMSKSVAKRLSGHFAVPVELFL